MSLYNSTNSNDVLKDLIQEINFLRNNEINKQDTNLNKNIYSQIYINWSFILNDLLKTNLNDLLENNLNIINLNESKNKLLDDILKQTNSENYKSIVEDSPELINVIESNQFIESHTQFNSKIKNMLLEKI